MIDLMLWLDQSGWPQRLVRWLTRHREHYQLSEFLGSPSSSGTHAVSLALASALKTSSEIYYKELPLGFGSWREYKVVARCVGRHQAVLVLRGEGSETEFTLSVPVHRGFPGRTFSRARRVRLTCEAHRSALYSVRAPNGALLAAGTLELHPRAAYSRRSL